MKYHAIPLILFVPVSDSRYVDGIADDAAEHLRAMQPDCRVLIAEDFAYGTAEADEEHQLPADISKCCERYT